MYIIMYIKKFCQGFSDRMFVKILSNKNELRGKVHFCLFFYYFDDGLGQSEQIALAEAEKSLFGNYEMIHNLNAHNFAGGGQALGDFYVVLRGL